MDKIEKYYYKTTFTNYKLHNLINKNIGVTHTERYIGNIREHEKGIKKDTEEILGRYEGNTLTQHTQKNTKKCFTWGIITPLLQ